MGKLPKWVTPERQSYLVKLWQIYGNKCLLGHSLCPIPEHYTYYKPKVVSYATPVKIACVTANGEPLLDTRGNRIYLTVYSAKHIQVTEPIIMRLYDLKEQETIRNWVSDDRVTDCLLWQAERKALHSLAERTYPLHGLFNAVSRDIYHDSQPLYYIEGYGLSGITFKPFVKVKLASSYMRLLVNLGDNLKHLSKNKRRKIVRYDKGGLPKELVDRIDRLINEAVRTYRKE